MESSIESKESNSNIDYLSNAVTPNCSGIIWLTQEKLDFNSPGVYEFNYLLNGLVTKSISNNCKSGHLFIAENFGRSFFVSHNLIKSQNDFDKVYQHFNVVSNMLPTEPTVLIFNQTSHKVDKLLSKKYQQVNFKYLTFETKVSS